jgi:hypothetical protein
MEIRTILRGALAGAFAGVLAFAFARILAEPVINKAVDHESGRDDVLAAMNKAAGRAIAPDGPEIFSRTIQSTVGIATGLTAQPDQHTYLPRSGRSVATPATGRPDSSAGAPAPARISRVWGERAARQSIARPFP